jgi:protein tyrosine/serine phosphatase
VFAAAARLVATPSELPLLFHCTAGKDRTGWLAAILLTRTRGRRDTVMADYLRTTELNATGRDYMITTMSARVEEPEIILPLLEARAEYLDAAFAEADLRYGGMEGYVREGSASTRRCSPRCAPTCSTDPPSPPGTQYLGCLSAQDTPGTQYLGCPPARDTP